MLDLVVLWLMVGKEETTEVTLCGTTLMARQSLLEHTARTVVHVPLPEVTMREERQEESTKSVFWWSALHIVKKKSKHLKNGSLEGFQNNDKLINKIFPFIAKTYYVRFDTVLLLWLWDRRRKGINGAASVPLSKDTGSPTRRGVRTGPRGLWDGRRRRGQSIGFCSPTGFAVERSAGVRRSDTESLLMMSPE